MKEGVTAVNLPGTVTIAEYLEGETRSEERHEFSDGLVPAMAGASRRRERVLMNLSNRIFTHLRGQPCEVFKSDMKHRLEIYGRTVWKTVPALWDGGHLHRGVRIGIVVDALEAEAEEFEEAGLIAFEVG